MFARPIDTARLEGNKAVVRRFVEGFNNHDLQEVVATLVPDPIRHSFTPDSTMRGLDAFKAFCQADWSAFPDSQTTITHLTAEGDLVAMYSTYTATQQGPLGSFPPTGKRTTVDWAAFFRMQDDRIAETWMTWDTGSVLVQLGHLPKP
jgi:steroid delta-isomerase-like uncharacterized protein